MCNYSKCMVDWWYDSTGIKCCQKAWQPCKAVPKIKDLPTVTDIIIWYVYTVLRRYSPVQMQLHCGFIFAFYFIFFVVCDACKLLTDVHTELDLVMLRFCSASLCWRWHWRFCGCSLGCRSKQQRRNPARGGQHMGQYNHKTPLWSYVETRRRISIIGLICLDDTSSVLWWWRSFRKKTYDI